MDDLSPGDLVFLTQAYEKYLYERHPNLSISFVNRLAKLEDIIDWNSENGKKIKEIRLKSGKWKNLPIEDSRYVFSVFYPEISKGNKQGVVERGVTLFSKDPKTGEPFFQKIPLWLYREFARKCVSFRVESSDSVSE